MKRWWLPLLLLLLILISAFLCVACGGDDDDDDNDDNNDDAADDDDNDDESPSDDDDTAPDAVSSASPSRDDTVLTNSHPGFAQADCYACHNDVHRQAFQIGECATCHGNNGAPQRAAGHATNDCLSCHAESHEGVGFVAPKHCTACHKYEPGSTCPATETYDAVVIGAGGGGVAAATALQQAGLKTALVEMHYKVGGYMTRFRRGDYEFEASLHAIGGLEPQSKDSVKGAYDDLSRLGIIDKIDPLPADPMYRSFFPGLVIDVPQDQDAYIAVLKELYPEEADGIDALFAEMHVDYELLAAVTRIADEFNTQDLLFILGHVPEAARLISYLFIDLNTMLTRFISDPELMGIFSQLVTYIGDGPSELQAVYFQAMWSNYHEEGFYYLTGGSQAITQSLADAFVAAGGTLMLNTKATGIVIEDGLAVQVQTENDVCLNTRYVVSNANAPETLLEMVGPENLPADYVADVENMEIGVATLQVFLGVDHDYTYLFEGFHELMVNDSFDMDENFAWMNDGDVENAAYIITDYSAADPTVAPEGKNVISLTTYLPFDMGDTWKWSLGYDDYVDYKEEVAWILIDRAEKYLPGLSDHIEVLEVGSPVTNWAFSGNPGGTIFGWRNTPEQGTLRRMKQQTPIDNLLLAGAWTFPGGGQSAVISSGVAAADMVLKKEAARN